MSKLIDIFENKDKANIYIEMSVNKIDIPYNDMVDLIGEPDKKTQDNNLKIDVIAVWNLSLFGTPFRIRYDSRDWAIRKMRKDNLDSYRTPPIEEVEIGEILGERELVKDIIINLLYIAHPRRSADEAKRNILKEIFKRVNM